MQPLISVYIPTCNRRDLLERAVNSVLSQTYPNVEILISDDCSEDDTQDFCENLVSHYSNIIYLRNEVRSGACVARNKAINAAQGQFITGLDDDDYFLPERLSELYTTLISNDYQIVFSNCKILISDTKSVISRKKTKVNRDDLISQNYIGNQVFTYTKNLIKINGFNESLPAWQDLECWLRLLDIDEAYCVHNASYIVDMSHPHERITTGKVDKVTASLEFICQNHKLKLRQRAMLSAQLCSYLNRFTYTFKVLLLNTILFNHVSIYISLKNLYVLTRRYIKLIFST